MDVRIAETDTHTPGKKQVRAVSTPGGLPRQYRVQYQQTGSSLWRVQGCYRQREEAEQAVATLERNGLSARLVEYLFCPAAA